MWKKWQVSLGVIVVATVAWIVFEWTNLPFLTISSDVLLFLIILLFLRANYAVLRNKYDCHPLIVFFFIVFNFRTVICILFFSCRQPPTLPELVVSEEMVNNAAASFRVKINNALLIANDITIGKDFIIFFKVSMFHFTAF